MSAIRFLQRLRGDSHGGTAIEYGLIVSLIVIAIYASMQGVADETNGLWAFVKDNVSSNMGS